MGGREELKKIGCIENVVATCSCRIYCDPEERLAFGNQNEGKTCMAEKEI
jgi:hypothetical protein